jgi:phosphoglucosamine mutase
LGKLFGTDGIRGEANRYPLDAATALAVGQAVTLVLRKPGCTPRVLVGKDTRLSGHTLESAFAAGVTSMGGEVCPLGIVPTPAVAFLTRSLLADAGVMITASHNPFEDNGLKVFTGAGFKLSDEQEERVEELVLGGRLAESVPYPAEMGRLVLAEGAPQRYLEFLKSTLPSAVSLEGLRIVLDTANGATYEIAPAVFGGLGADVTVIHNTPNGLNINQDCGSQHTGDLSRAVVKSGAVAGLAFDGDGDRLIAVDENGVEITGDQLLIVCASMLKAQGRLKDDLVVSTVMSNMGFNAACGRLGFTDHAAKVGDRYVLEDMLRLGGVLGGEQSGHAIFLDHQTTGDGILTGIQLLAGMLLAGKPLSELAAQMDVFPQELINVEVIRKPDLDSVPEVVEAIRQAEAGLKGEGRVLVRYSGTQTMCRVMVEGPTAEITEKHAAMVAAAVRAALGAGSTTET